ncbi:MAG TPA: 20S proteasome subunit A/B [Nitrospiraceae bacterium]|nr:20S proteasome subunit A/B [Nitrospiraceae bacterium]
MYEEPYRWVEAVGNRRHYLDEQFRKGSPVVAASCSDGIILVTFSRGTPKLYEIYDRLAFAGMGHPADLEKLRFNLLELAHVEGFNRSPSDVTGSRLMKNGLAPLIKQAFEEIYKAPFIVKILLAELGAKIGRDLFLTVNYDGTFEESANWAVLAASETAQASMHKVLKQERNLYQAPLAHVVSSCLLAWAVGSLAQRDAEPDHGLLEDSSSAADTGSAAAAVVPERSRLLEHLRATRTEMSLECAILSRAVPGSSKYRVLNTGELAGLLPPELMPVPGA